MPWSIFQQQNGNELAVGWAQELLRAVGAPVTPGNTQFIYNWEQAEGGGGKYNPLNQGPVPGQPQLTTTGEQYGGGAADFASWQAGIQGAADYLRMGAYSGVLQGLKSDNPQAARSALFASPWAASHYGWGSAFPDDAVPGGKVALPPAGGSGGGTTQATDTSWWSTGPGGLPGPLGLPGDIVNGIVGLWKNAGNLKSSADSVKQIAQGFTILLHALEWFFYPSHWIRMISFGFGLLFLIPGLYAMMRSAQGGYGDVTLALAILFITLAGICFFIAFHNLPADISNLGQLLGWIAQSIREGKPAAEPKTTAKTV